MDKTIHDPAYRTLIQWLSQKRTASGLTIRELAAKLDWHHSMLGRIETFERRLDLLEYVKLCDALECDPSEGLRVMTERKEREHEFKCVAEKPSDYLK